MTAQMVREIAAQAPLASFAAAELAPGPGRTSDAEIDAHIRATAITVHHPLGTCKMGPASDPDAVVDPELRVLGVDGLRVAERVHAPPPATDWSAATMLAYAPQRQMLPLIHSRAATLSVGRCSFIRPTAETICPGVQ